MTGNGYDSGDRVLWFGWASDIPVVGDWDGTGKDRVGVFRDGAWYRDLDGDGYTPGRDDTPIHFGWASDIPVPADWNGDGKDTPGVFRQGTWVLDETGNGYTIDDRILVFGFANAQPVAADWDGDNIDEPGVLQSNGWVFDLEGNGYTGEIAHPNTLGSGKAIAGNGVVGKFQPITVEGAILKRNGSPTSLSFYGDYGMLSESSFDIEGHIDRLSAVGVDGIRVWVNYHWTKSLSPFVRHADGRYDLRAFDQRFFDRLRATVDYAASRNIVVQLAVFDAGHVRSW